MTTRNNGVKRKMALVISALLKIIDRDNSAICSGSEQSRNVDNWRFCIIVALTLLFSAVVINKNFTNPSIHHPSISNNNKIHSNLDSPSQTNNAVVSAFIYLTYKIWLKRRFYNSTLKLRHMLHSAKHKSERSLLVNFEPPVFPLYKKISTPISSW